MQYTFINFKKQKIKITYFWLAVGLCIYLCMCERLFEIDSTLFQGAKYFACTHACGKKMMMTRSDASLYCLCLLNCHLLKFRDEIWLWQWQSCIFIYYYFFFCSVGLVKIRLLAIYTEVIYFYSDTGHDKQDATHGRYFKTDVPWVAPVHAWTWEHWHLCVKNNIYETLWFSWCFKRKNCWLLPNF